MISQRTIAEVLDACHIEDVIGEFVVIKKSGQNYKGLSPFSNEKTPSFVVSPAKQIFKDFSTGKGGNVFSFLMEHEHFSYPEAIRYVAKRYNITIEEDKQTPEQIAQRDEKESLFIVNQFAQKFFSDILINTTEGKNIGLSYFKERRFSMEVIEKFQLGYSPNKWSAFTDVALEKGYQLSYLEKTGLTIVKGDKKFDRFKGRVIFPIHSLAGRILGFGGRILIEDKKVAKYLNSPESEIYHKSNILYGIKQAKQSIVKEDNCYLVEGYTDVISLYMSGVQNVVASSGTALSSEQIRLIKRLTPNITILYDGDRAGISASFRGIDMILEQGMNVKVVLFPDGEDPDSYACKCTNDELLNYLENNSTDFIRFKISILNQKTQNDPIKRAELIKEIIGSISKIPDHIKQNTYIKESSVLLDVKEEILSKEIAILEVKKEKEEVKRAYKQPLKISEKQTKEVVKDDAIELNLIKLLVSFPNKEIEVFDLRKETNELGETILVEDIYLSTVAHEICDRIREDKLTFSNPIFQKIFELAIEKLNVTKEPIESCYFSQNQDIEISKKVSEIVFEKHYLHNWKSKNIFVLDIFENLSTEVSENILRFKVQKIDMKIEKKKSEIKNMTDTNKKNENMAYLNTLIELKRVINNKLRRVV